MFKMLPERIEDMLTFFDECGYNTGSYRLSQSRKVAILIHFVHFSMAVFFSLCLIHSTIWLLPAMRFIGLLNYVLQISTAIFTYWFIIFDSLLRWQKHQQFWRIFQKTYESYSPQCSFKLRLYLIKFVQFFSATLISVSIFVSLNGSFIGITVINAIPVELCQIRIFYYIFCLEFLHFQLKVIERELMTMKQMPQSNIDSCRFKWLREYYHSVYEMSDLLNQIFDWSHLAAVPFRFYLLLTELNWFLVDIHNQNVVQVIGL